jgi:pantetheine-phosphate adenylyltransferase
MSKTALFPGSFDPVTNGHIDLLERATHLFDRIVVTIAVNPAKKAIFSGEERAELIRNSIEGKPWAGQVEIDLFTGLLIDYARQRGIRFLIRGVRQLSDFEYEFRMALTNRRLSPDIDTVFLMPDEQLNFISASLVRDVAYWGGDLSSFVPDVVAKALADKYPGSHRPGGGSPTE